MTTSKFFTLVNNENNRTWVINNLDERDYKIILANIHIYYFQEDQKTDILNAIKAKFGKLF